jgi:hypothetical protein
MNLFLDTSLLLAACGSAARADAEPLTWKSYRRSEHANMRSLNLADAFPHRLLGLGTKLLITGTRTRTNPSGKR